jgi:N-acetylmuramic acid 6-phosphate etherase
MQLTNKKLIERGTRMIVDEMHISKEKAREILLQYGSVKKALEAFK